MAPVFCVIFGRMPSGGAKAGRRSAAGVSSTGHLEASGARVLHAVIPARAASLPAKNLLLPWPMAVQQGNPCPGMKPCTSRVELTMCFPLDPQQRKVIARRRQQTHDYRVGMRLSTLL